MYLFFNLNVIVLGLCSGRKFALLTAGAFDVLLQSLPIAVSSPCICSHLSPSPLPLSPYLHSAFFGLVCPSHGEFVHTLTDTHTHTHRCLWSQLERQYHCAVASPTTKLISLLIFHPPTLSASHLLW